MSTGTTTALALAMLVGVPVLVLAYLSAAEGVIRLASGFVARASIRPWMWLAPGLALMGAILFYPLLDSIRLSFFDAGGQSFAGLDNYSWLVTDAEARKVLITTLLWIILLPLATTVFGTALAVCLDRMRWERAARSIFLAPVAISFVAAAVVWQLVYSSQTVDGQQLGVLNAVWTSLGGSPVPWLVDTTTNNVALVVVAVWTYTGFATLILSAAVKGVPQEQVESATLDGARGWQIFRYVTVPHIRPALVVVLTTLFAWSLKIFDVVFVLTGGRFGTSVVGTETYNELFTNHDIGRGSTLAVALFVAVVPLMILSARRVQGARS